MVRFILTVLAYIDDIDDREHLDKLARVLSKTEIPWSEVEAK